MSCYKTRVNPHTYYEGEWEIVKVIQADTIHQDLGTITLSSEIDESSFNRLNYSDPTADSKILGLRYMRRKEVIANDMYWFLDLDEKRFFLYGISPLKSWIQVYTIQEDEAEIRRNQEMTLFLDIREPEVSGQETIILKKSP
ncbi:MAG: hypothetical protein AAFN10_24940 [Bacteroidota bacterium]